jgi:four helix bundle protein
VTGDGMTPKHYRELITWQKAMDLVTVVYQSTKKYPKDEIFGLTSQTRRAAVSLPSNIAEGQGRRTTKDFLRFLAVALGSLCEVETQLLIGQRLGYLDEKSADDVLTLAAEVGRLLNGLMKSLEAKL